jgi:hypothetical protein
MAISSKGRPKIGTTQTPILPLAKLATGIEGIDLLSHGGLPRHRTSQFIGGPGAGKTKADRAALTTIVVLRLCVGNLSDKKRVLLALGSKPNAE